MFGSKRFSAVILAGGMSSRMEGVSKQQIRLCGVPVVVRSMRAFEDCAECGEIVVVSRADECALYDGYAKEYAIGKFRKAVPGGQTRQDSAFIGLSAIDRKAEYVAFHDAARCLILPEDITRVFRDAKKYKCAAACRPVTDTIKIAGGDRRTSTEKMLDRGELYAAETPQIFLRDLYEAAAHQAAEDHFVGTDDCSLLERCGFGCKLVLTGAPNIKITHPEDAAIAETLIRAREARNAAKEV